ncbi:MAG: hypothetical protein AVDCRST_MAG71-878, partial [uncultured Lysobacter sp.]
DPSAMGTTRASVRCHAHAAARGDRRVSCLQHAGQRVQCRAHAGVREVPRATRVRVAAVDGAAVGVRAVRRWRAAGARSVHAMGRGRHRVQFWRCRGDGALGAGLPRLVAGAGPGAAGPALRCSRRRRAWPGRVDARTSPRAEI